jgi:hypothetical protein
MAENAIVPAPVATPAPVKPGYKTSEFWLNLIAVFAGLATAGGMLPAGGMAAQICGTVIAVLASLGYTNSRTQVKNSA